VFSWVSITCNGYRSGDFDFKMSLANF